VFVYVENRNLRQIFETVKCSINYSSFSFYICEVTPEGGGRGS
jgi:hypothetical protein